MALVPLFRSITAYRIDGVDRPDPPPAQHCFNDAQEKTLSVSNKRSGIGQACPARHALSPTARFAYIVGPNG
jgi:hypothetical protein